MYKLESAVCFTFFFYYSHHSHVPHDVLIESGHHIQHWQYDSLAAEPAGLCHTVEWVAPVVKIQNFSLFVCVTNNI